MRGNRCQGYVGLLLLALLSCGRTGLEGADLPAADATDGASGGLSSVAGRSNGGASMSGGADTNGGAAMIGGAPNNGGSGRASVAGNTNAGGGNANGGASGGSAGVGTSGGGAGGLTAGEGGVGGQIDGPDLYVDPLTGDDTRTGTRQEPLRTIAHAASLAGSGSNIVLLDGVYDRTNQPQFASPLYTACGVDSGVVIPSGVTLRADHSGAARLSIVGYHGLCVSGGRIDGLRIERPTPGTHVLECDRGELEIHESSFSNVGFYVATDPPDLDLVNGLVVSGSAHVTLTPGNLADYSSGPNHRFAAVTEQATLTIVGGVLSVVDDPLVSEGAYGAALRITDSAALTVHGLDLHRTSARAGTAIAPSGSVQVRLDQGTSVHGFGEGFFGTKGAYQITLDDVDFFDNDFGVFLFSPGDLSRKSLAIANSRFTRSSRGALIYAVNLDLTVRSSSLTHNDYAMVLTASGSATLDHVSFTDNDTGLSLFNWNTPLDFLVSVRSSQFSSNTHVGISASGSGGHTPFDLGTVTSPGNNVLQGNGLTDVDGANLVFGGQTTGQSVSVLAVGNTWDPGAQGADLAGQYTVAGSGARLEVTDGAGPNYRVGANYIGSLRLAENP